MERSKRQVQKPGQKRKSDALARFAALKNAGKRHDDDYGLKEEESIFRDDMEEDGDFFFFLYEFTELQKTAARRATTGRTYATSGAVVKCLI